MLFHVNIHFFLTDTRKKCCPLRKYNATTLADKKSRLFQAFSIDTGLKCTNFLHCFP